MMSLYLLQPTDGDHATDLDASPSHPISFHGRVGANSNSTCDPHARTPEQMQPPPQLVQWLRQNYPKPSVDEVRVLGVNFMWARALTTLSSNLGSTGFRNATLGWSRSTT